MRGATLLIANREPTDDDEANHLSLKYVYLCSRKLTSEFFLASSRDDSLVLADFSSLIFVYTYFEINKAKECFFFLFFKRLAFGAMLKSICGENIVVGKETTER